MSSLAHITVDRKGAWVVAGVSGELDVTGTESAGEELIGAVPNDAVGLVIDLSATTYLDSAAIELLFDLSRRLARRRQRLRLVAPESSPLTRVLELTDVGGAAPLHRTLAAALDDE